MSGALTGGPGQAAPADLPGPAAPGTPPGRRPYPAYPLLSPDDVPGYLESRGLSSLLGGTAGGPLTVREVSDGNLNRIFLVRRDPDVPGLAVKQALPWVRVHGESWPLTPYRAAAEARAYEHLARVAPEFVPAYHGYDPATFTLVMEDLGDLDVLRAASIAGRSPGDTGAQVGVFVARLAFATSDFGMSSAGRKKLIAESVNPELCELTEDVVLTEPYIEHEHNGHHPALDALVREVRADPELRREAARLKHLFTTKAEALIHGDLHSGSVMVGGGRVAVIDPEFSFVGPIGFDLGLFWANALIAAIRGDVLGSSGLGAEHLAQVAASWEAFTGEFQRSWPTRADGFYPDSYLAEFLRGVWHDGLGYAGSEAMRRAVGYAHAADLETLPEPERPIAAARVVRLARELITRRHGYDRPDALARLLREV
ncbi:S-methyl-5-thioribose kinase [Sphaerisporangium perillae]|uniref:S-methyl-5-thioribose kinase n=1 Tax=Sphaerisporangium perillae TaxID=2935860 RepID=UPI0020102C55|nr:S-methyl-5-thioribose kinase [Sphaerisporangium perillae]